MKFLNSCGDTEYKGDDPKHAVVDVIVTTSGGLLNAILLSEIESDTTSYLTCTGIVAASYAIYVVMRIEGVWDPQER